MDTKGILMHIDRTNEITMATEAALAARPSSAFGLVTMPAAGKPAGGSSFGAGRARDAGLLRFVGEVVDVAAIFPLRHTAIVAPAAVPLAHAVRVADEECADLAPDAEVDDVASGLKSLGDRLFRRNTRIVFMSVYSFSFPERRE